MKYLKSIFSFFGSVYSEAKKVEWLKRPELYQYTFWVIASLLIFTGALAFVDVVLIRTRGVAVECYNDSNFFECVVNQFTEEEGRDFAEELRNQELLEENTDTGTTVEVETSPEGEDTAPAETSEEAEVEVNDSTTEEEEAPEESSN